MTVIAWDGKILAADKQASIGSTIETSTKIWKPKDDLIIAVTGQLQYGLILLNWYMDGCDPKQWPEFQRKEDWTRLVIVDRGIAYTMESEPVLMPVEDPFCAWGVGRDFAIGAMAASCNAIEAVEIANKFSVDCGQGVDWFAAVNLLDIN